MSGERPFVWRVDSEGRVESEWRVEGGGLFGRLRARGERPLREGRLERERGSHFVCMVYACVYVCVCVCMCVCVCV